VAQSQRLASLDAFRGLTILGMLLVNNVALDAATPRHLTHAPWNGGVHFADLVFPWFLLIVGVALPFSAASRRKKGISLGQYYRRVLSRSALLVLLGCFIDSSLTRRPLFGLGVLQLIGLAYLVAALLYEMPLRLRLLAAAGLLIAHWAALRFLPVPGVGAGVFTEDQNLVLHWNQAYLQPLHLKGLLSVVPTSALALIGTALGDLLRRETAPPLRKVTHLLTAGLALILLGWIWNLDLPFNKPVWTASYICFAAGWGAALLGLLYLVIDVRGWRSWSFPLIVFGANAIVAYVAPILAKTYILQEWRWPLPSDPSPTLQQALLQLCIEHAGRIAGGWMYTGGYILFWWLILLWLYRRGVFVRV
jgi:predicted acyltransferase